MYKNKKILGIIPARKGSKSIKNKNFIKLGGKELVKYTIEAGNNSKFLDRLIISTDAKSKFKKYAICDKVVESAPAMLIHPGAWANTAKVLTNEKVHDYVRSSTAFPDDLHSSYRRSTMKAPHQYSPSNHRHCIMQWGSKYEH